MKNYIKVTYSFAMLLFFGCNSLLDESPKSLAEETFYNTAAEIEAGLFAIYAPLRSGSCMGGLYPAQQEAMPDYGYGRGSYVPVSNYQGLDNTNISRVGQMWNLFYESVRNANLVIINTPNAEMVSESEKARFIAEARFMRGMIYFIMVRNWAGIPLRTEANMTVSDIPRSSVDDVYELIVEDLQYADQNLPENPAQAGRPTSFAAKTVLADVFLHQGLFSQAEDKALEVIESNKYALLDTEDSDNFQRIYGADVVTTSEEIFYLKYSREDNQGFNLVMFPHHPGSGLHGAGGYFAHYTDNVTNPFIVNWDNNDLRKNYNIYSWNIGLGPNTMLFKKFVDPAAPGANSAGNDYPLYRYADLLLIHSEASARSNGGPSTTALESLNQVHRRAYGFPHRSPSPIDFKLSDYNLNSFLELVIKERGYETMFEGKRWMDLKRLGIAERVIQEVHGMKVDPKHYLWPIPIFETDFNNAIDAITDQNPGY
ncbi:RagB/SusD family nutrient uptake outer membrane protein [Lunatibacter salilacus]|uniref:RagB/SusD family nutrient uptake outer membrane protein n=1 Tax=Lunatibacter salilacus TaxID=2483804 RepID=UPI00131D7077|nr:RagB/SusD family nutrient uptake outer membrane protein [Lunatibacter salilacus]